MDQKKGNLGEEEKRDQTKLNAGVNLDQDRWGHSSFFSLMLKCFALYYILLLQSLFSIKRSGSLAAFTLTYCTPSWAFVKQASLAIIYAAFAHSAASGIYLLHFTWPCLHKHARRALAEDLVIYFFFSELKPAQSFSLSLKWDGFHVTTAMRQLRATGTNGMDVDVAYLRHKVSHNDW